MARPIISRTDFPIGYQNKISIKELAVIKCCTARDIRASIADLRSQESEDGYCIVSTTKGNGGYWRTNDPAEIRRYLRSMESRAKKTFVSMKEARKLLAKMDAQPPDTPPP